MLWRRYHGDKETREKAITALRAAGYEVTEDSPIAGETFDDFRAYKPESREVFYMITPYSDDRIYIRKYRKKGDGWFPWKQVKAFRTNLTDLIEDLEATFLHPVLKKLYEALKKKGLDVKTHEDILIPFEHRERIYIDGYTIFPSGDGIYMDAGDVSYVFEKADNIEAVVREILNILKNPPHMDLKKFEILMRKKEEYYHIPGYDSRDALGEALDEIYRTPLYYMTMHPRFTFKLYQKYLEKKNIPYKKFSVSFSATRNCGGFPSGDCGTYEGWDGSRYYYGTFGNDRVEEDGTVWIKVYEYISGSSENGYHTKSIYVPEKHANKVTQFSFSW